MPDDDFVGFLARVRSGDAQAAENLVRQYEAVIRREVRLRLTNPSVYRLLDDDDVCQSVLASFFVRALWASTTCTTLFSCGNCC